jgi:hypothetical protein
MVWLGTGYAGHKRVNHRAGTLDAQIKRVTRWTKQWMQGNVWVGAARLGLIRLASSVCLQGGAAFQIPLLRTYAAGPLRATVSHHQCRR